MPQHLSLPYCNATITAKRVNDNSAISSTNDAQSIYQCPILVQKYLLQQLCLVLLGDPKSTLRSHTTFGYVCFTLEHGCLRVVLRACWKCRIPDPILNQLNQTLLFNKPICTLKFENQQVEIFPAFCFLFLRTLTFSKGPGQ